MMSGRKQKYRVVMTTSSGFEARPIESVTVLPMFTVWSLPAWATGLTLNSVTLALLFSGVVPLTASVTALSNAPAQTLHKSWICATIESHNPTRQHVHGF